MIITSLILKRGCIQIFLDNEFFLSVSPIIIAKFKLFQGKIIQDPEEIKTANDENILLEKISSYRLRKKYSSKIIFQKLNIYTQRILNRKISLTEFDVLLEKSKELILIEDEEIIKKRIEDMIQKNKGPNFIFSKLTNEGFDRNLISQYIENSMQGSNNLTEILEKKLKSFKPNISFLKKKEKLIRFGLGRGFDFDEIKKIVDSIV